MRPVKLYAVAVVFLTFCRASTADAQVRAHGMTPGLPDTSRTLLLGFERLLNTLTWRGSAALQHVEGPFIVDVVQHMKSRLLRFTGSPRQDEYSGHIDMRGNVSDPWAVMLHESSSVLTGPGGGDLGALSQHSLVAGPSFAAAPWLSLQGLAGWVWNRQLSRESDGLRWALRGTIPRVMVEELEITGDGRWDKSDLNDRQPHDVDGTFSVVRRFGETAGDSLVVSYRNQRRDLLTGGTGDFLGGTATAAGLLRRQEEVVAARNAMWFAAGPDFRGTIEGGWGGRTIDRSISLGAPGTGTTPQVLPSRITQLSLDFIGRMYWLPLSGARSEFSAGISTVEERHDVRPYASASSLVVDQQRAQARRRSNQAQRVFTSMRAVSVLDASTQASLSGSASMVRYDTPDSLNTDDRDDLLLAAAAEISHQWSRDVTLVVACEAGMNHLVYLSRYQSANNVKIRTLRLAPGVIWSHPNGFRNVLRAEVAASYTVYDFEDQIGSVQSFAYRQAAWSDSLVAPLGPRLQLEFTGTLRLFERGLFRWRDFRERLERSFVEIGWWPAVAVRPFDGVRLSVGYRAFVQERYVYRDGERAFDGVLSSSGPTVAMEIFGDSNGSVQLAGWRETQRTGGRALATVSNLSLSVNMLL
ncbi:MAG: hypothetical protein A3G43_02195 [Ignavibacteria bacterium RIFCSPLOWO2_12_FULL_56_21]|nr:MAG: hypothetical protein A3G43_02195 [Ignavibacteria bacterium RIFCSPLOWO2_12_FULL_56_21]